MTDADRPEPLTLVIGRRFNGPPDSANGGYFSGTVAAAVGDDGIEVTLRLPPPLERALVVDRSEASPRVFDGDVLVAETAATEVGLDLPSAPPSLHDATEASNGFAGFDEHVFPTCFVCGPRRPGGDGLSIYPGPTSEGVVAAPWRPDESLTIDGEVPAAIVWAALDCPSGWAITQLFAMGRPAVLGRMAARVEARPRVGEPHVVVGWHVGTEGRKHFSRSGVFDADGVLLAAAASTWIELRGSR